VIVGIGIDLVHVERTGGVLTRFGDRFVDRVLAEVERGRLSGRDPARILAKYFSAKEAAGKALGTGVFGPVGFHHIILEHRPSGRPMLRFVGPAAERAARLGARRALVSITDEAGMAAAVVILDSEEA